jgi:exopolysaccharide biosynthesis polyprenyl glycosylphosphotransferase
VISERAKLVSWAYLATDLTATAAAFLTAYAIRRSGLAADWIGPIYPLGDYVALLTGFILPGWALIFYINGLYGRRAARTLHTEISRVFRALMVCALALAVMLVVFRLGWISRPLLGIFLLLNAVGIVVGRGLVRGLVLESTVRRRVLVAGALDEVRTAAASVEAHADWGLELVGVVSDGTWTADDLARAMPAGTPAYRLLGSYDDIPALSARAHHVIDEVLIAPSGRRLNDLQALEPIFLGLEEQGIATRLVVNFLPRSLSELSFDDLGGMPLLTFSTAPHDELVLFVRRAIELVLASALLVVLSPLLLIIAALIKLDSPGPVLFKQLRAGLHGRQFTFLKFRSMRVDAEALKKQLAPYNEMDGPAFKMTNDPRVTPLGRFLRRTSLDELPQLWNIVRGDMSVVGPRPAVLEEVRQYEPWQRRRLSMKPGLTCLWQVSGRNELTFEEWMRLDLEYIDNWSLWLDVKIAFKTIPAVLLGRGAR